MNTHSAGHKLEMARNSQVLAGVLLVDCGIAGTGMSLADLGTIAHLKSRTGASPCTGSADSYRHYKLHQSDYRMLRTGDEDIQPALRNFLTSLSDAG